jgi:hypothetical protein
VILFDAVVQILALANLDRLQSPPRPVLRAVYDIAGHDRFPVRLAAVDDNPIGVAMTLQGFPEEALRGCQVAVLTEMELNRITAAVDGSVRIHPLTPTPIKRNVTALASQGDSRSRSVGFRSPCRSAILVTFAQFRRLRRVLASSDGELAFLGLVDPAKPRVFLRHGAMLPAGARKRSPAGEPIDPVGTNSLQGENDPSGLT